MLAGNRYVAGKTGNSATAFICSFEVPGEVGLPELPDSGRKYLFSEGSVVFHLQPHLSRLPDIVIRDIGVVIQVGQQVRSAHQFSDTGHPEAVKYLLQLIPPTMQHVDDPLRAPRQIHQSHQFQICGRDSSSASTAAFAIVATNTFQRDEFGSACDNAIGSERNGLGYVERSAQYRRKRSA